MSINVELANSQAQRIRQYSSKLLELKNSLAGINASLHEGWKAQEMNLIDQAFQQINQKLAELSTELHSLGADVIAAAYEIKLEEDLAKEKAEKKNVSQ